MPQASIYPKPLAEVLRSVFDLTGRGLTKPLAEKILELDFPGDDAARMDELSVKANEGALTSGETAELESYIYVEDLLAYWQTRARQFLEPPA